MLLGRLLAYAGQVVGVIQLLDRHGRDAAALAARYDVPLHVAPRDDVPGSPFRVEAEALRLLLRGSVATSFAEVERWLAANPAAPRALELEALAARIARESADAHSTPERPRWVLGSVGPGTKLPTLGHLPYAQLRDAYATQVAAMVVGSIDAVLVETSQDLLQTKAAVLGAKRAMAGAGSTCR